MNALLVSVALLLAPVHDTKHDSPVPAPHESLVAIVKGLRANDLKGAFLASVGEAQYAEFRSSWEEQRKTAVDPAQDGQFRVVMAMLVAPGAEDALMAQLEPKLAEMKPQVAMLAGMISGMGQTMLQQNADMSAGERAQAQRMLDALGQHLMTHDLTDPASARKAVGILCTTARKLELASLSDVQALSFDGLLGKVGVAFGGLKGMLEVYGISLDRSLDTFRAETVSQSEDSAVVRVRFEFLGVEASSEVELVKSGFDWLPKPKADALAALGR